MLFSTAGVNKGVKPFKLLCLNSDPQCDTASQLKIEMLDESWMGDTFLESFMVSQVRMATPAPGSWQEREGMGKGVVTLLSLSAVGTLRLWGRGKERACTVSIVIILGEQYRWGTSRGMSSASSTGDLSLLIGNYILNSVLHDNLVNVKTYQD